MVVVSPVVVGRVMVGLWAALGVVVLRVWLVVATSFVTCCPIVMLLEEVVVSTGITGIAVKPQKSHISESSRSLV